MKKIDFYVSCVLSSFPLLISIFGWSFNLAVRSSAQSPPPKTFPSRLRAPVRSHFSGLDSIAQICVVFLFVLMVSVFSYSFRFSLLLDSRTHRIP
jgi:hypothetical protein